MECDGWYEPDVDEVVRLSRWASTDTELHSVVLLLTTIQTRKSWFLLSRDEHYCFLRLHAISSDCRGQVQQVAVVAFMLEGSTTCNVHDVSALCTYVSISFGISPNIRHLSIVIHDNNLSKAIYPKLVVCRDLLEARREADTADLPAFRDAELP